MFSIKAHRQGGQSLVSPHDIASSGLCIGCGGCVAGANRPDTKMRWDRYGQLKPSGPTRWLRERSAQFARICPFSPSAQNETELAVAHFPTAEHDDGLVGRYEAAYVGYAAEENFRSLGSSGGMVSWVAAELLRTGLVDGVAHVIAGNPEEDQCFFRYQISRTAEEIRRGAKSRYYPIELSAVIEQIRAVPGRYAVIGIPCFIKAIHLLRAEDAVLRDRIAFTLGLYCGHMKSARMVESFAWQMGTDAREANQVEFRLKNPERPAHWYTAQLSLKNGNSLSKDWWHLVDGDWGAGFFQNSACNFCDDVVAETADISFGDAWLEPYSSDGRGTNVIIVRSPVVHGLVRRGIEEGRLNLQTVDRHFVEQTQAAGFRQRREGLAYRLRWLRPGVRPRKRVAPASHRLPLRRKLIYRVRNHVALWSHRIFYLARRTHQPGIYIRWARSMLMIYQGLTYSRGAMGKVFDRILGAPVPTEGRKKVSKVTSAD